ncbi:hypothetical protein D3C87_1670830 [compost metagenome]
MGIDVHILGDDTGYRSQAAGNPHGADIGVGRQSAFEHARIKLVGLAIDVEIRAGKIGFQQRRTDVGRSGEQLVNEMIFRAPDLVRIKPCRFQKGDGVTATAMG